MATRTTVPVPQERPTVALKDRKIQAAVRELRTIAATERTLAVRRSELEKLVKTSLGTAELGTIAGKPVVSYVESIRTSMSQKMIKEKYPDIASECVVLTRVRSFKLLEEQ